MIHTKLAARSSCGVCGLENLETFLSLGASPLANSYPPVGSAPSKRYPLSLAFCNDCMLVQQMAFVPNGVLYGQNYGFYSGTSPAKRRYHAQLANRLMASYLDDADRRLVLEIGCNDGDLLLNFQRAGYPVFGIDPSRGPVEIAVQQGIPVLQGNFTHEMALALVDAGPKPNLIIANHVAAHVYDLNDFFAGIDELLDTDGTAVIEVQYLMNMLLGNQFDQVYHEHRYHFSFTTLMLSALKHGLFVAAVSTTPQQSGSISVSFTKDVARHDPDLVSFWQQKEEWLNWDSTYMGVQGRADALQHMLISLVTEERLKHRTIYGWAASAKAVTLLNWCGLDVDDIEYIVDSTPHKQGKFLPGTKIPIVKDIQSGPDTWLVLASNYLPELLRQEYAHHATHDGRWIIPTPVPVLL